MPTDASVAIVTGASRGLGRHVARRLAAEGRRVVLAARHAGELEDAVREIAAAGGEALAVPTDVTRWSEVEACVAAARRRFGPVDVLINNAGLGWYKPFVEWSVEEIDATLDVNLKGTVYMTRAVLPEMLERRRGQIVNVASDLARRPLANMAVYAGAKHGVLGFAGSLLREVRGAGIKVMTLTPGIIDTWFNGGQEGTRDASWALDPAFVAEQVARLLALPEHWLLDEVAIHPLGQDF